MFTPGWESRSPGNALATLLIGMQIIVVYSLFGKSSICTPLGLGLGLGLGLELGLGLGLGLELGLGLGLGSAPG